jgi:hypothetical protein
MRRPYDIGHRALAVVIHWRALLADSGHLGEARPGAEPAERHRGPRTGR